MKWLGIGNQIFTVNGTTLVATFANLVFDNAAASMFVQATNTLTLKNTAASAKFSAMAASSITVAASTTVSGGLTGPVNNAGTVSGAITGAVVNSGTLSGTITGNVTNTGTLSSGATITGNVSQATPTNLTGVTITGNLTFNTNTPTTITLTNSTITGTVSNTGTGAITVRLSGSTVGTVGSNITTQIVTALSVTGLTAGSQIYVANGAGAQVAYVSSSSTSYSLDTTGGSGTWTVKVARYGFTSQSFTFTPASSGLTQAVSLIADAFITQATAATVAAYTTLETPDRIYDFAAYFETTNAGIKLARIASKQGTNVSLGAYNVTMTASTAFDVTGNMVTLPSTAAFVGGSTMTGGLTTSGNVTLNAQATAAGAYAPISGNNIALAGLTNYNNVQAATAITGLKTSGAISAAGTLVFGSASAITATGDVTFGNTTLGGTLTVTTSATPLFATFTGCSGAMSLVGAGAGTVAAQLVYTPASAVNAGANVFSSALVTINALDPQNFGTTWALGWISTTDWTAANKNDSPTNWGGFAQKSGTGNSTTLNLLNGTQYQLFLRVPGYFSPIGPVATIDTTTQSIVAINLDPDLDESSTILWPQTAAYSTQANKFTYDTTTGYIRYMNSGTSTDYINFISAYRALELITKNPSAAFNFIQPVFLNGNRNGFSVPPTAPVWITMHPDSTASAIIEADVRYSDTQLPAFDRFVATPPYIYLIHSTPRSQVSTADKQQIATDAATATRTELATELAQVTKVAKLHGIGASLVVTPTTRVAGTVSQSITTEGTTTTVAEV
jgi:hypothetical protein